MAPVEGEVKVSLTAISFILYSAVLLIFSLEPYYDGSIIQGWITFLGIILVVSYMTEVIIKIIIVSQVRGMSKQQIFDKITNEKNQRLILTSVFIIVYVFLSSLLSSVLAASLVGIPLKAAFTSVLVTIWFTFYK